jgi:hypothetical protein
LELSSSDQIWGATYLEVDASMDTIAYDNVWMNVVSPSANFDFLINPNSCPSNVDTHDRQDWLLYPNPAGDFIYCQGPQGIYQYEILDFSGKVIEQHTSTQASIFVGDLSSGLYFLKALSKEGITVHSFVKE